ncbi:MFS general substrate transporter [Dacryopinax primogenitus]|uniref:MFS general substrate transporter n=1 Tax=Dacryopinax primogenitus (strain DJM 731) TaxID=1858805 RepID=M5GGV1_DACPD|nr:MFS general substrate transporter [Dacryopinax primogenitus]EJU06128.1 MFS general substrate transporter [Dacryopinax primogenitus]
MTSIELADRIHLDSLRSGTSLTNRASALEDVPAEPQAEAVSAVPTLSRRQEWTYLAVLYWAYFVYGWNDGSTGPLLLRIQDNYNVTSTIVSLLFVGTFIGYVFSAALTVPLMDTFGFGKICSLTALCQVAAYALMASALPFPAMVSAFVLNGFAVGLLGAQANVLVTNLPNSENKHQLLHASYGVGATVSPLVATLFSQTVHWSFQYLITACFALLVFVLVTFVFRLRRMEDVLGIPEGANAEEQANRANKFQQLLTFKAVHLLAFFLLFYEGLEATIGGWIVTYLTQVRGAGPSAGYISSGFWRGLTVGRLALMWVNKKIDPRRVIFFYLGLAIAMEALVCFVPWVIGDAIAIAGVGLVLGPFFPLVVGTGSQLLPRWLLAGSIGWIASVGQVGSALFPFLTGLLSQKFGIKVLQPLLVAMMASCIGLWALVPAIPRRTD